MMMLICNGCTTSLISVPELKQDCPKLVLHKPVDCVKLSDKEPFVCPTIAMPDPIPKKVTISIDEGEVFADEGGEKLLRAYAGIRKQIKESLTIKVNKR